MASVSNSEQLREAVKAIHYIAPWVILAYYVIAATVSVCTLQTITAKTKDQKAPRKLILWVMLVVMVIYIGEAFVHVSLAFSRHPQHVAPDGNIYLWSSVLVWLILTVSLLGSTHPVWFPFYGSWVITLVVEVTLITLSRSYNDAAFHSNTIQLLLEALRAGFLTLLLGLLFGWRGPVFGRDKHDEESTPLLAETQNATQSTQDSAANSKYGSTASTSTGGTSSSDSVDLDSKARALKDDQFQHVEKRLKDDGNWWTYARGFFIFLPYIWPVKQYALQLRMVGVGLCLLCVRVLNLLIPRQLGIFINALSNSQGHSPYLEVGLYLFYFFLASNSGVRTVKNLLWLPVEQYAYKGITTAAYNHIMELSSDFHDGKQSGELYKAIEQGKSVNQLLETVLFGVLPMLIDLFIAFAYLSYLFGAYMALIVGALSVLYLWISTYFTAMQSDSRRRERDISRKEYQILYDTMGNWRTVSFFNRISYEQQRYSSTVGLHMNVQRTYWLMYYLSRVAQSLLLDFAFAGACLLVVYQVINGVQTVGGFVTLFTYWHQLTGPLMFFSNTHAGLLKNLIDAEQLLQVFLTKPSVVKRAGAKKLNLAKGDVEYTNVNFSYDGKKQILKDLSFRAAAGQTIALIGETGSGKSTILKLLFRFYDVTSGSIIIDGQDIRDVTLQSLRECIGAVPQDSSMFNDTVMNNIRYSRLDATDEEVFDACKAAAIHDKIITFTHGYQSKVGEHGVRLSGGELQRVAIARALLKNSRIILLDEATSSVDTETERHIQDALAKLTSGRTTFVVAHRLSTIINADLIIVIKEGGILEKGTHSELFHARGKYHDLWAKQSFGAPGDAQNSNDSIIVNDVCSDRNIQALLEAAKNDSDHQDRIPDPQESISAQDDVAVKVVDKEGKPRNDLHASFEKKTLKPDAPDFVPRNLQGTASKEDASSHEHSGLAHDHGHSHQDTRDAKYVKRADSAQGAVEQGSNCLSASQQSLVIDQESEEAQAVGKTQKERKKRMRNRREKSKTELAKLERSQTDGTVEMEPGSSSQGGSVGNVPRRMSAPSGPSSALTDVVNSGRSHSRRRQRHWKVKNRAVSRTQSTEDSANSTDIKQPETPHAPSVSPTAGVASAKDLATAASSSGVPFVPGL